MVKIPTYQSKFTPQPSFTKPVPVKGVAENIQKVANYANSIADAQAEIKAYEKGYKQQQLNVNNFVASDASLTLTGEAYRKGAQAAFVSNFKTTAENQLNDFSVQHQYEPEKYKQKFDAYKTKALNDVPSTLLPDLTNWLDGIGNRVNRSIQNNKLGFELSKQIADIEERYDNILPQLTTSIKNEGYDTNTSINFYADIISNIKALEEQNAKPSTILKLKKNLRNEIVSSSLINEFNKTDDKQQFIKNVRDGKISTVLADINDTFKVEGFETGMQLTNAESVKYASQLNTLLKYDIASNNVARQTFADTFDVWYDTSLQGLDAGDTPSITDAQALFFRDEKIEDFQNKINLIETITPDINRSRFGTLSESQNILKEAQSQYASILQQKPSTQRNKDLIVAQAKIQGISKNVDFKQKAINEGNPFKILSLQGIEYSFDDETEITKTHNLVKTNVGISADRMLLMPQANLEALKSEFEDADNQSNALSVAAKHKAQFGKYTNHFLKDSEMTKGFRVVYDMIEQRPSDAGTIWQSLTDLKQNEDALKNSREDFASEKEQFANSFKENFGDAFRGNEDLFNDIYAGAYAYYTKTLATVGANEKAIDNTIKLFSNTGGVYQFVEINDQTVFIPNGFNGAEIAKNVNDMFENPHRYNITSSANFTLQDIVENKDEYTVVAEGGTVKLVQNSNILFAGEIFQKLPSGSKSFVYSDVIVSSDDGFENETSMIDFDETWNFDKPKNFNKKVNSQIPTTKIIETSGARVGTVDVEVETSTFEKVQKLKEIFYKEVGDEEGMPYVDIFVSDIAVSTREQQNLNAISFYIKDGNIQPYMLDYLSTFDYLGRLSNKEVQKQVIKQWQNNTLRVRTTSNTESSLMTPLQSLTDIIRDIEVEPNIKQVEVGGDNVA
jgi:hypothetical protein